MGLFSLAESFCDVGWWFGRMGLPFWSMWLSIEEWILWVGLVDLGNFLWMAKWFWLVDLHL